MSRLSKEWKSREKPCYFRLLMKRHCVIEKERVILSLNLVKPKCLSLNNQRLQNITLFSLNTQMMWAAVSQTCLTAPNCPLSQRFPDSSCVPMGTVLRMCRMEQVFCVLPFGLSVKKACGDMLPLLSVILVRLTHKDVLPSLWPGAGGRGPICTLSYSVQSKNKFFS